MNITTKHFKKTLKIIERIYAHENESEMRADIAEPMLDLLDANYFASFRWNPNTQKYTKGVYLNMDESNIKKYCDYYQFKDPITAQLARKKMATTVSEIMPHKKLCKTEFFNDFLLFDGLFHGVNLHLYNYENNIGDFRIWRKKGKADFDNSACTLLNMLKPHMIQAINIMRKNEPNNHLELNYFIDEQCMLLKKDYKLTAREVHVARLLLKGESDDFISHHLYIGTTTVRTHVKNIFKKTKINSRTKLQNLLHQSTGHAHI